MLTSSANEASVNFFDAFCDETEIFSFYATLPNAASRHDEKENSLTRLVLLTARVKRPLAVPPICLANTPYVPCAVELGPPLNTNQEYPPISSS